MASLIFYLSATVLFAQSTVAFDCSKQPIYVDIHKRAVHDSSVFQYGSFIGVGQPAQNHSLWPSLSQNHTSFASLDYCKNSTLKNCDTSTGGFFNPTDSEKFQIRSDFRARDSDRNGTLEGDIAQDTLHLYTHYFETDGASQTLLENSIIEVAKSGSIAPGRVGLGLDSTLLGDLAGRNMIAGRTYSLYIGQGFERAGGLVNGSITFGGFDSGRFTGVPHSFSIDRANMNSMGVKVKDIYITDAKSPKSNTSLFDTAKFPSDKKPESFQAQITTDQFPLSLPYQITQNFIKHLDAQQDNKWGDSSLKLKNAFNGTLSIVIESREGDYTVTLPPEVLVNASNITPIQNREEKSTEPFYLSAAFLSQVYLMVDFDNYAFFLADAVQKNNAVMPVTFCPKSTPTAYKRPKASAWVQQGLIGAVIGGVLGGIGIMITAYCFVLGCRSRRAERKQERELERGRRSKIAQMEIEEVPEFDPPPKSSTPFFWKKS